MYCLVFSNHHAIYAQKLTSHHTARGAVPEDTSLDEPVHVLKGRAVGTVLCRGSKPSTDALGSEVAQCPCRAY